MSIVSATYWEQRYAGGGRSGPGSMRRLNKMKVDFINAFIVANAVPSIIDFGVGDGNFAKAIEVPSYVGVDVSPTIVAENRMRFATRAGFQFHSPETLPSTLTGSLGLSLDVIFHLVEDAVYEEYMSRLFSRASDYVVIYSSNTEKQITVSRHVRHRAFSNYVDRTSPEWQLTKVVPNKYPYDNDDPKMTSFCDFYVYAKGARVPVVPDLV